uniref:uncharacterized protein n=1 Tax=Myxine glutinosa TaxID=7769 RepID=UPI00358E41AC
MSEIDEMEVRSEASVSVGSEPEMGDKEDSVGTFPAAGTAPIDLQTIVNLIKDMRDEARAQSVQMGVMRDEARGTGEKLDKKIGKLDNNFEGLDNGIKEVKNGLMGVENRMAAQENQIEGVKNGLEGLENSMEGKIGEMAQQLGERIDGIEGRVQNQITDRLGKFEGKVETQMGAQEKPKVAKIESEPGMAKLGIAQGMAIEVNGETAGAEVDGECPQVDGECVQVDGECLQVNVECPQVSGEGNLECESCNGECFPHSGLVVYRDRVDVTTPQPGDEFGIVQHQGGGAEQEGVEFLGVHAIEPDRVFIGDIDQSLAGPGMISNDEDDLIQRLETCDSPMEVELVQAQRSLGEEVSWSEEVVGMTEGTLTVHCYLETEAPKLDNQLGECVGSGLDLDLGGSGDRASGDLVPVGNLDQLQGGAEQPVVEVVPCSCGLAMGMKICKIKFKIKLQWEIDLEQPWWGLVPGLRDLDMERSWVMASGKSCPFQNLGMPASWGAVMARFGRGVQPWVSRYDLGPTGGLVECGVPCPSGRRPSWWLGPAGSPDPGGG